MLVVFLRSVLWFIIMRIKESLERQNNVQQLLFPPTVTSPRPKFRLFSMTCCTPADPKALSNTCEDIFVYFTSTHVIWKGKYQFTWGRTLYISHIPFSLWQARHGSSHFPILIKKCDPGFLEGSLAPLLCDGLHVFKRKTDCTGAQHTSHNERQVQPHKPQNLNLHLLLWKMMAMTMDIWKYSYIFLFPVIGMHHYCLHDLQGK